MASFNTTSASIRIANKEGKRVLSATNVSPTVTPQAAAGFVAAVETMYNNGDCNARVSIAMELDRQ